MYIRATDTVGAFPIALQSWEAFQILTRALLPPPTKWISVSFLAHPRSREHNKN